MRTKEELVDRLAHVDEMLSVLRRRLYDRELQEAQYSINIPPEITSDIYALNKRILKYEGERSALQTEVVEGDLSIAEAEYRMLLAETWGEHNGFPSVSGAARLEFTRLRLGISTERALELEQKVRHNLAQEVFAIHFDVAAFRDRYSYIVRTSADENMEWVFARSRYQDDGNYSDRIVSTLKHIAKAHRLDADVTKEYIESIISKSKARQALFHADMYNVTMVFTCGLEWENVWPLIAYLRKSN